jgi:hypothetical protein
MEKDHRMAFSGDEKGTRAHRTLSSAVHQAVRNAA